MANHTDRSDKRLEDRWPHSDDAELSLLGSLLIDGEAVVRVRRLVQPRDCWRETHRTILQGMYDMQDAGIPVDLITVIEHLRRRGLIDEIGGVTAVSALGNQVPTSANVEAYAREVANTGAKRRMLAASAKIAALAVEEPDARVALTQAQHALQEVAAESAALLNEDAPLSYGALLDELFADILDRMERPVTGVLTGIPTLDVQLGGLEPGDLIYLCGRPGSGKSALAVALATGIARRFLHQWQERQVAHVDPETGITRLPEPNAQPQVVDIVTLEMRALHQVRRIVAAIASVNSRALRAGFRRPDGTIDSESYHMVKARAFEDRANLERTLYLHDHPLTLEGLRAHVLNAVALRNTQVVVIDQLDLISDESSARAKQNEYERITRFSRALKQLALEANVAIICLAQLSRDVEKRQNRRPMLSDLRSSGQLEQDADVVLGIYRGAYYDVARARKDAHFAQFVELTLLKVRDGEANVMTPLRYEGPFTRFSEWPEDWEWPADETRGLEG